MSTAVKKFYAVKVGRQCGIFDTWPEASAHVVGYPSAVYKSFKTKDECQEFIEGKQQELVPLRPPQKKSKTTEQHHEDHKRDGLQHIDIYTDGSCPSNGSNAIVAGCGVYFGSDSDPRNISVKLPAELSAPTNNAAELYAIQLAIESFLRGTNFARTDTEKARPSEVDTVVTICTDSTYAINCITRWADGWEDRGWKSASGEGVKNVEIIKSIRLLMKNEVPAHVKIAFKWVKGHKGIIGNEKADQLANKACGVIQKSVSVSK
jgi:ribonuclease HI